MDTLVGLYAAEPFWVWAGLAAALLAIEVLTGSGWLLWAAASAGVTAVVVAVTGTNVPTTLLIFALLTMASTLAVRRYFPRSVQPTDGDINDNIGRLVGNRGSSVGAFTRGAGRVAIDGKEWAAQLDEGDELEPGASVQVISVVGSRL